MPREVFALCISSYCKLAKVYYGSDDNIKKNYLSPESAIQKFLDDLNVGISSVQEHGYYKKVLNRPFPKVQKEQMKKEAKKKPMMQKSYLRQVFWHTTIKINR